MPEIASMNPTALLLSLPIAPISATCFFKRVSNGWFDESMFEGYEINDYRRSKKMLTYSYLRS